MSGELTPSEVEDLLRELEELGAHVVDVVDRVGGKLNGHIEWLTEQVEQKDKTIAGLEEDRDNTQDRADGLQDQLDKLSLT